MVSRYIDATQQQQSALRGGTMEVDIDANVPKMKTQGKLHALKSISKLGKITYHALGFSGDNSVKTEVIARYLKAEVELRRMARISPSRRQNYKFKYKGMEDAGWPRGLRPARDSAAKESRAVQGRTVAGRRDLFAGPGVGIVRENSVHLLEEDAVRSRVRDPERRVGAAAHGKQSGCRASSDQLS